MDVMQYRYILERETEINRKKRIVNQLDIAEAINYAYLGSQAVQKGKTNHGAKVYKRWRNKKFNELYPEAQKNRLTVWDKLGKKSKKFN